MKYKYCDDWFIYAEDEEGNLCMVSTEQWPCWLNLHEGADEEPCAVETYMLPIARRHWDDLPWVYACPAMRFLTGQNWKSMDVFMALMFELDWEPMGQPEPLGVIRITDDDLDHVEWAPWTLAWGPGEYLC